MARVPDHKPSASSEDAGRANKDRLSRPDSADSAPLGADLSPGLGQDFPLRLELALNGEDPNAEGSGSPFMILSDYGGAARVYVGRIVSGHGASDRYVAVKMQMPRAPEEAAEDYGGVLTHPVRARRWLRETGHYLSVAKAGAGFTPVFFVEPAPERSGESDSPRPWPPLFYSVPDNALFQPLSERGTPLVTCRDSGLLVENGLPAYGSSPDTFLYNEEDIEAGEVPTFYENTREPAGNYPNTKTLTDCLEALARIPGMPGAKPPDLSSSAGVMSFAKLCASFPLMTCRDRDERLADVSYVDQIVPFSFEDTNALVMELNRFHYHEFCDLLGGISEKAFRREYMGDGLSPGQRLRLGDVEEFIEGGRRLMFSADGSGMDALEVFKLKWTLLTQTCQAVYDLHRRCRVAHLRIEPSHVMVQMRETGGNLPTLWQFEARLISLGATALESRPEEGLTEEVLAPPVNANPVYLSSFIANSSFGMLQTGSFTMTALAQDKRTGKSAIDAEIHHEGIGLETFSLKDRVKVVLKRVLGLGDLSYFAQRDPERPVSGRSLFLKSFPLELSETQQQGLAQIQNKRIHNVGFALYPQFHAPCDIYSLGMLLFRTLVVNDGQSIGEVALALDRLKTDLASFDASDCQEGEASELWRGLTQRQSESGLDETFGRAQVFYGEDDRAPERPNAIPEAIWHEAIILGLRMITHIEGFSVCADPADFDARYPAGKMEPVIRRAQEILRQIDTVLFSKAEHNAEIRAALAAAWADAKV